MKNDNNTLNTQNDSLKLDDFIAMFLSRWPWFVISIVICLTIATFYILKTTPSYIRTATILIKDSKEKGASSIAAASEFQDMGLFKSNTNINNELLTIQSPTLMEEVVKTLKLNEVYSIKKGLRYDDLYKKTPVLVTFTKTGSHMVKEGKTISFNIELLSADSISLSHFCGDEEETVIYTRPYRNVKTPAGELMVTITPKYTDKKWKDKTIYFTMNSIESTTDRYSKDLKAELSNKKATVVDLTISDHNIEKAEDILNTLIKVYNTQWVQDKNQVAVSTSQFINDRLNIIENELGTVDNNISNFKSANMMPDVQAVAQQYMQENAQTKKAILDMNTQLTTARYIQMELKKKNSRQPLPLNTGLDYNGLENQIAEYNTLILERNKLLANSSENNPLVQDMNKSLASMQEGIMESLNNVIASINIQIANLRSLESTTIQQLTTNPKQAKHLLSVERQQKVKEELYLYLLQKREENELGQAFTAYNTRVITAPRGPAFPTAPKKKQIILIAFVIGLCIPAGIIYMIETCNTKVRGKKDIEKLTIPFVGEIPLTHEERKRQKKNFWEFRNKYDRSNDVNVIVVKDKSRNVVNEAFRVVRTNLEFMTKVNGEGKVIMMTSANPGSGKTFLTANLATSLAIKNGRVLCIDFDLRRASLSGYVNNPQVGVANYLNGNGEMEDVIVRETIHKNLDVIPVGTIPPNPTELLGSDRLKQLIAQARKEYDYVLLDCPPVEIVADSSIVTKFADITLFVIRAGLLHRDMLNEVESFYTEKKFTNLAILLNGTETRGSRYGYRYGYHYGYSYAYHSYAGAYNEKDED